MSMTTPQLSTKYVFTITANIGSVTSAGEIGHGVRRIIPITGGEVRGDAINGKVCAFGADFQIIRPNELIELEAKYAFETDDGAVVYVENKGIRFRNRQRKVPLADGIPVHRIGGASCRPRRDRRAPGAVNASRSEASGSAAANTDCSLPPCGGELERGVSHERWHLWLTPSLTLRRKGGGNRQTSAVGRAAI